MLVIELQEVIIIKYYEDKIEKLKNYKISISNENSEILNSYSNIQKIFPQKKIENNYNDIIMKYQEKGYKKINFPYNSIFKDNPFLINNNNKLTDYYEEKRKKK